jgi:CrcB protein
MGYVLLVGIGGFIGSALRYLVGGWAQRLSQSIAFPYGTLTVNLIGCFVIGLLSELAESQGLFSPEARAVVLIGLLGGFTTFSTFSNETYNLARGGQSLASLVYLGAHILFGLGFAWFGHIVAQLIWR